MSDLETPDRRMQFSAAATAKSLVAISGGVPSLADSSAAKDVLGVKAQRDEVLVRHDVGGREAAGRRDLRSPAGMRSRGPGFARMPA